MYSDAIEFQEAFKDAAYQFQVDRATVFSRDRSKSVGASEVFTCMRKVRFDKDDLIAAAGVVEKNPTGGHMLRGQTMESNFIAPVCLALFGDHGYNLGSDQVTYLSEEGGKFLTATPDGRYDNDFLVEFKTVDPRIYLTEAKVEHINQTHVQMGVTKVKTYTFIVYVNAADYFDIRCFRVDYNENIYLRAVDRADRIMCSTAAELPMEGRLTGACDFCKHKERCAALETIKVEEMKTPRPPIHPLVENKAQDLLDKFATAKKNAKEANNTLQEAEHELALHLMDHQIEDVASTKHEGKMIFPAPREVLDRERIENELGINLDDFKTVKKENTKPQIKVKKRERKTK